MLPKDSIPVVAICLHPGIEVQNDDSFRIIIAIEIWITWSRFMVHRHLPYPCLLSWELVYRQWQCWWGGFAERKTEVHNTSIYSSLWNRDFLQQSSFDCKIYSMSPVVYLWFPFLKGRIFPCCFLLRFLVCKSGIVLLIISSKSII